LRKATTFLGMTLTFPRICDKHSNCAEADKWAARFGAKVTHPNPRVGDSKPYGKPVCSVPGCSRFVVEWGQGHEGHAEERVSS
jgi:hypothetical protein